jgi:tyrosinase
LAIIAYSAFDPLFFLHHANVDRIFAMWQVIHNDTYVVPTPAMYSSHTQNQGDIEDIQTPLKPFFVDDSSFWTSDMVRDHEVFGYTYAEVFNKSRGEVVAAINRLYTDFTPVTMTLKNNQRALINASQIVHGHVSEVVFQRHSLKPRAVAWQHQSSSPPVMSMVFRTDSHGTSYREWIANIKVKKHALNSSFLIYLFLGIVPNDSYSWPNTDHLVGSLGVFANNGRPMRAERGKITGTIPLTSALMRMVVDGHVSSLDSKDVEPFLRTHLELRVALVNGTVVNASKVDGFSVNIVSSMVTAPASEDELPQWGEVESHFDLVA